MGIFFQVFQRLPKFEIIEPLLVVFFQGAQKNLYEFIGNRTAAGSFSPCLGNRRLGLCHRIALCW